MALKNRIWNDNISENDLYYKLLGIETKNSNSLLIVLFDRKDELGLSINEKLLREGHVRISTSNRSQAQNAIRRGEVTSSMQLILEKYLDTMESTEQKARQEGNNIFERGDVYATDDDER